MTSVSVSFLTNREQLEQLMPPSFTVDTCEPIVTVEASYIKDIEWLAGRGYNTLGVSWSAVFKGSDRNISGKFLSILWENLADPIITGREDLGFSKMFCDIPEPISVPGEMHCLASWQGFQFLKLSATNLEQLSPQEIDSITRTPPPGAGVLHYKYVPKTGDWGQADVAYTTLTPFADERRRVTEMWRGTGKVAFSKATWEELPTLCNIVNAFANLEKKEFRGSVLTKLVGGKDLSDQRIIK
jgi:hypothetical protein